MSTNAIIRLISFNRKLYEGGPSMNNPLKLWTSVLLGLSITLVAAPQPESPPENATVKKFGGMTLVVEDPFKDEKVSTSLFSQTPPLSEQSSSQSKTHAATTVTESKTLYLTFDDGPVEGTENLLNVLEEEGVEATLFCVGRHAKKRSTLFMKARANPRLLIANHTYSHANGKYSRFYSNLWGVMSDVEHAQLLLGGPKYLRLAGRNVWRLPEVHRNDGALSLQRRSVEIPKYERLAKEGFFIYGWDVEWHFDRTTGRPVEGARRLANRIESIARHQRMVRKNKVILLAHDFMFKDKSSAQTLRSFIRIMRRKGWSFRTIAHYSAYRPQPLYVAKYYRKSPKNTPLLADSQQVGDLTKRSRTTDTGSKNDRLPKQTVSLTASSELQNNSGGMVKRGEHPNPLAALSGRQSTWKKSSTASMRRSAVQTPTRSVVNTTTSTVEKISLQGRLNKAIRRYDARQVDQLIAQGAQVNQRDEYGWTPLNTAIKANSMVLVKKLLSLGADIGLTDAAGVDALHAARIYRRKAIENYLSSYASRGQKKVTTIAQNDRSVTVAIPAASTPHTSRRRDPLEFFH